MTDRDEDDVFGRSLSRAMKATISNDALCDDFADRLLSDVRSSRRRRTRGRRLTVAAVLAALVGVSFAAVRVFDGAGRAAAETASVSADAAAEDISTLQNGETDMNQASVGSWVRGKTLVAAASLSAMTVGATPVDATLEGGVSFSPESARVESTVQGGAGATAAVLSTGSVQEAPISLAAGDAADETSFNTAGHWSDMSAPGSGKDYLVCLGDEAGLRTPDVEASPAAFAGDSLAIGALNGAAGCLYLQGGKANRGAVSVTIPSLLLAKGCLKQTKTNGAPMLLGSASILSPETDPFLISGSYDYSVLGLALTGAKDTAVKLTGTKSWIVDGDNSGFGGQIVVDGNLKFCISPNASNGTFGDPSVARDDAIVFRNGAGFSIWQRTKNEGNVGKNISAPTRGVWFEPTSSGFTLYRTCSFDFPISGGTVKVSGTLDAEGGGRLYFRNDFKAEGLDITGGAFVFGCGSTCPVNLPVKADGGYIGCAEDVTLLLTMNKGYIDVNQSADWSRYGVLTVAPGSTIAADTIQLRLYRERDLVQTSTIRPIYPSGLNVPDRLPVLRVPTSVKTLTPEMFSLKWADLVSKQSTADLSGMNVEIETKDGWQTVYLTRPSGKSIYVDPSSPSPAAPYVDWNSAAHDIQTAITYAESNASDLFGCGVIRVKRGTYDISQELTITKGLITLISDDGEGNRDPEHTILDGGFGAYFTGGDPARTNRILRLKGTGVGRVIDGFTFRHGAYAQKTESGNDNCGGGAVCAYVYNKTDTTIANCRFVENWSKGNGGALQFVQSSGRAVNCVFIGNRAQTGGGAHAIAGSYGKGDQPCFVDCAFTNNVAVSGGGVYAQFGGDLIRCDFHNCNSQGDKNNHYAAYFAAPDSRNGGYSHAIDCTISCCTGLSIAAVGLVCSNLTVRNCSAGNYLLYLTGTTVFSGCTIESNVKSANSSLPYVDKTMEEGKFTFIDRLTFRNNTGGACLGNFVNGALRNSLVAENSFAAANLKLQAGTAGKTYRMDVDNCTFADNTGAACELAQDASSADTTVNLRNTIFANGASRSWTDSLGTRKFNIANCCLERTPLSSEGYTVADTAFETRAKFKNAESGDYRLKRNAPEREAGRTLEWMTADSFDLSGSPRIVDRYGKVSSGALPDIGAYECLEPTPGMLLMVR